MIKILTTPIHHKISGGNIYNLKLISFLKKQNLSATFEIIEDINTYIFEKENKYIIDGILIEDDLEINSIKDFEIVFLVHFWPSLDQRHSELKKNLLTKIETEICENLTVIVTGMTSITHIEQSLNPNKKDYFLAEPAIDFGWKKKKSFAELPKKIIYLANFIEGKGHPKLIEISHQLRHLDFTIDCYGEILSENCFSEFKKNKEFLNLTNIDYKGILKHSVINELLLEYDLLLHLSDYETFGMSVFEALSTKVPVVITPTGNYLEYKNNGVLGILNTFETNEIVDYLSKMLTSETFYKEHLISLSNFSPATWESNFQPILNKFL